MPTKVGIQNFLFEVQTSLDSVLQRNDKGAVGWQSWLVWQLCLRLELFSLLTPVDTSVGWYDNLFRHSELDAESSVIPSRHSLQRQGIQCLYPCHADKSRYLV
jgi:hypothetical protein